MTDREIYLDAKNLLEQRMAESLGLDKYASIMNSVREVDVSSDQDFQRIFNSFYKVRKNAAWRNHYYSVFEHAKYETMLYEDILEALYDGTGFVESSFATKLLATLDDGCPIIDQYVLKNTGLVIIGNGKKARLDSTIRIFYELCDWYDDYLDTKEARENIDWFDRILPNYAWISDVKKIDYLLWAKRD